MVDVEQRALSAFEQHRLPFPHRLVQEERDVADVAGDPGGIAGELLIDRLAVQGRDACRPEKGILLFNVGRELFPEDFKVQQVPDANAAAGRLVFVRRPDSQIGGADSSGALAFFGDLLDQGMIGKDEMSPPADH